MKLSDKEIDDIKHTAPVYVSAKAVNPIVPMVEAKLTAKREWVGLSYRDVMGIFEYWDFKRDSSLVEFNKLELCELFELVEAKLKEKNT